MNKTITAIMIMALSATQVFAQEEEQDPPIAYGYNHTLEIGIGNGHNLKSYSKLPDKGTALFGHDAWGIDVDIRYTRFFSSHWGAFIHLNALSLGNEDYKLEKPLSEYYNHGSKEVRVGNDDFECGFGYDNGASYGMHMLGVVYRYDIGRWSFRPHFGIGRIHQHDSTSDFYVVDTSTDDKFEWVSLTTVNKMGKRHAHFNAFAYSPSIQITFSPRRHFFFSAEMEWTGTIGHLYQHTKALQCKATEPQDWKPESDGFFFIPSYEYHGVKTDDHLDRVQMGNFIQFRFGIGWNIGHNRNVRK